MAMTEEHKAKIKASHAKRAAEKKLAEFKTETKSEVKAEEKTEVKFEKKVVRRKTSFGPRLKLGVEGSIQGYKMKWSNDYDGELEDNLNNGWKFVGQDEVDATSIAFRGTDKDTGNRISRETSVGPGVRIRCYLLKIENEIYDEIMMEGEQLAKVLEKPIYNGTYGLGEHDYKGNTRVSTT
jgi:hypothetical protein